MLRVSCSRLVKPFLRSRWGWRSYVTSEASADIRSQLLSEVKQAMKNKDKIASTTIRSVLSEVYMEDKASNKILPNAAISRILRKAVVRRADAAAKFIQATRPDLAEKENREAEVLSKFLPPLLSEAEIDRILTEIMECLPAGVEKVKSTGRIFKEFYLEVDQSTVDPNVVKQRTAEILARLGR